MGLPEMTSTKYVVTGDGHTQVKLLALTLFFGMVSSVVPVFNMETYIVVAYARSDATALQLALIGSARAEHRQAGLVLRLPGVPRHRLAEAAPGDTQAAGAVPALERLRAGSAGE